MQISFEIEGEVQLARRIRNITSTIKNFKGVFKNIGTYLVYFFKNDVFNTEGSVFGENWASGKYYNKLQRSGRMRNSFIHKEGKDYVLVTNTAPYFKYHQSRLPRRKLPRRVMMKLDETRKQTIVKEFQKAIIEAANT
ncbi:MAG: hypothetical protein WC737_05730 [Parcubacteria group bacterium]